jgi:hypothetical protein
MSNAKMQRMMKARAIKEVALKRKSGAQEGYR